MLDNNLAKPVEPSISPAQPTNPSSGTPVWMQNPTSPQAAANSAPTQTPSFVNAQANSQPNQPNINQAPPPVFTQQAEQYTPTNSSMIANFKHNKSSLGTIIGIIFLLLIAGGAAFFFLRGNSDGNSTISGNDNNSGGANPKTRANLVYWGLWEPNAVLQGIIDEYQTQNPGVTITYVEQSKSDYRRRLQSAIENGEGPDMFRYHNTWFPMIKTVMQPDSKKRVSTEDYYPIIKENVIIGGETFGVPLYFDDLLLYYNPQKFQAAGLSSAPLDWTQLMDYSEKLTVRDPKTGIQIGGVAMGTTNNVDHWSDLLGLLLLQSDVNPAENVPTDVLQFYTQFSEVKKVWDATLPKSTYAFAVEKAAMIFGPSWRAHEIRSINPNLEFKTAPVPQLTPENPVAWASYWLEGVSRKSPNSDEAWKFLAYLSNAENLSKLYTTASQVSTERKFGEPYPRISMANSLQSDPIVGAVVNQAPYAKSWYLCSRTYDDGLNDGIIKYFEDAINAMNKGDELKEIIPTLTSGINQKLKTFGVATKTGSQQEVTPIEDETMPTTNPEIVY